MVNNPTVYLVACTQQKIAYEGEVQAKELYTQSAWFRHARSIAEARADNWFILSAWYGLLHPWSLVRRYNAFLGEYSTTMRKTWASAVHAELARLGVKGCNVVVLAGEKYAKDLVPLLEADGCTVLRPMQGMGIGYQLGWMAAQNRIIDAESHFDCDWCEDEGLFPEGCPECGRGACFTVGAEDSVTPPPVDP
jgi:hypothetical protein